MARRRNARSTTLHRAIPIALGIVVATAALSIPASAQPVEIAPVGGYRFGGGFFEQVTQQQVDLDGAPVFGLVVNVPLHDGLFVEAFASHQQGSVTVPESATAPSTRWRIDVDHFQAGGLQEFFDAPPYASVPDRSPGPDALRGRRRQRDSIHRQRRRWRETDARAAFRAAPRRPAVCDVCRGRGPRDRLLARGSAWSPSTPTSCGRRSSPRRWSSGSDRRRGLVASR